MFRYVRTLGLLAALLLAALAVAPLAGAAPATQATGKVTATDQPIVNKTITVANVSAGQDGWIVVHIDDGGGPGAVLGETAVKKGENPNVKVELSQDLKVGTKVWPMLHIDAGKIGTYEFPGPDAPVKGADGQIVMKQIAITGSEGQPAAGQSSGADTAGDANPSVDVDDQPIANGTITLAEVTAAQDGWIAVHLDEGGSPGKVIGHGPVKKGESYNVKITLDQDVPVGGKVWPMLHIDAGTIGTYEFPGADAPVIVSGDIVMKQIAITAAKPAGAQAPAGLPRTGGADTGASLLALALALLLGGGLLRRFRRA